MQAVGSKSRNRASGQRRCGTSRPRLVTLVLGGAILTALLTAGAASAAKPFGVLVADGYGEFQTADADSGGSPCVAGLLTPLSTGGCGIHPSYAGQALLAQAVERVIRL